jgi:plastocyanin
MRSLIIAALLFAAQVSGAAAVTIVVGTSTTPVRDAVVALDPLDNAPDAMVHGPKGGVIDQVNKRFEPRISVFQAGVSVKFPNRDQIRHQVYSFSPPHPFNLKLYAGVDAPPVIFDKPGLVVLGCNIHDSMVGFVAIVQTPYFGRTDATGRVSIDAPPGQYRLRVWHPDLAQSIAPRTVTVGEAAKAIPVAAELSAEPAAIAAWID